ncbi:MAG: hypothetical protein JWO31_3963 [Phycisphaerales bacterium]|nr:hypothetical protein [Phycisphaerales bacterium]
MLTHTTRTARRPGFTLIEILGCVVILGILSAVIVPQINSRDDQRAAAAARVVVADLTYAQNRAVARQKTHYVVFSVSGKQYKVLDAWSPQTVIAHPVDGSTYVVTFGSASTSGLKDMALQSAAFDGKAVLGFDALGIPLAVDPATGASSPLVVGSVVVTSGVYKMTVNVSPYSGELTVQ